MDKAESKARDRLSRGSGPLGELAGFLRQSDGFGELPALDKARGEPPACEYGEEMARSRSKHRRKQMKIRQHWKKRRERKKAATAK